MVDQEVIVNYLTTNKLTMTKDPSGIHYNIINTGVGNNPSPTATVEVRYKGTLMDGTVFDQTGTGKSATFQLTSLIPGWRIAIPLLKKEEKELLSYHLILGTDSLDQVEFQAEAF